MVSLVKDMNLGVPLLRFLFSLLLKKGVWDAVEAMDSMSYWEEFLPKMLMLSVGDFRYKSASLSWLRLNVISS